MPGFISNRTFSTKRIKASLKIEASLDRKEESSFESPDHARKAYRDYVGRPEQWDLVAARQVTLLMVAGLRDGHRLVDVGCGALRAGRLLIPYLKAGNYFGVEPNRWLVKEGIQQEVGEDLVRIKQPRFLFADDFSLESFGVNFDFALAHSLFSHTYPDLALTGLQGIARSLERDGKLFASFVEGEPDSEGSGWLYPGLVQHPWEEMRNLVIQSGLVARRLDWMQPRESWFVAAHPAFESEIDALSRQLRLPYTSEDSI